LPGRRLLGRFFHRPERNGVSASPEERWNEPEAIVLLQRAGKLVAVLETTGARMPQGDRALYHARLVDAHDAQDIAAYRCALEGYVGGARKAYRKAKPEGEGGGKA
jgi:hypothetical protein